jgi:hypothetical protein
MLAHLLDMSNLQSFAFQCEDEPVETCEIHSPLPCTIAYELVATQTRELLQVINAFRELNDVHTLDIPSSDNVPERAYCELGVEVASFELPRSERDLQEVSPWLVAKVSLGRAHILGKILHPKAEI